jgi:hypothetical protein
MDKELHISHCQEQFSELNVFGRPKVLCGVHCVALLMFYGIDMLIIICSEIFVSVLCTALSNEARAACRSGNRAGLTQRAEFALPLFCLNIHSRIGTFWTIVLQAEQGKVDKRQDQSKEKAKR